MVDREITDGRRIATLLRAEVEGLADPPFDGMRVVDPRDDGDLERPDERSFDVELGDETIASVFQQDDRVYLEFDDNLSAARERALDAGLRTRPKATTPPGLLVFVENGASVKRAVDVLAAAATGGD